MFNRTLQAAALALTLAASLFAIPCQADVLALAKFDGNNTGFDAKNPWLNAQNTQADGALNVATPGQWAMWAFAKPIDVSKAPVWYALTAKVSTDFKGYAFFTPSEGAKRTQMGAYPGFGGNGAAKGPAGVPQTESQTFLVKVEISPDKTLQLTYYAVAGDGSGLINKAGQVTKAAVSGPHVQGGDSNFVGLFDAVSVQAGKAIVSRICVATTPADALGIKPADATGPEKAEEPLVSSVPRKTVLGADDRSAPAIIPWPTSVKLSQGAFTLTAATKIVATNHSLTPLATVLSQEIAASTGLKLATSTSQGPGDIVLKINPALKGEAYRLTVSQQALVEGGSYASVATGTVSLLQSLARQGDKVTLPMMTIEDQPATAYRGVMIDLARKYHSLDSIKQVIQLCRMYKIRYLQLHLTDDQGFMFPSKAYPLITSQNQNGGNAYTLAELKDLVAYADARNVIIIPEFDVPGHSAALNRTMTDLFKIKDTKPYEHHASINIAKPEVVEAISTIITEMCEVFKSSPYFHIGGDEADLQYADQNVYFKEAEAKTGLANHEELYRRFLVQLNDVVKKNGKRTIVWEGFGRDPNSKVQMPKDMIVMVYENRFYLPHQLVEDGYEVINASWTPLYVLGLLPEYTQKIFDWNLYLFGAYTDNYAKTSWIQIKSTPKVIGSQICSWEQHEANEVWHLRWPLAAMAERVWNPQAGKSFPNFQKRLASTDAIFDTIAYQIHFNIKGLTDVEDRFFTKPITLTMSTTLPGATIRYTLDNTAPTDKSPAYAAEITIDKNTTVRAAMFDKAGKPVGTPRSEMFIQKK